jgi:hypothetical protein
MPNSSQLVTSTSRGMYPLFFPSSTLAKNIISGYCTLPPTYTSTFHTSALALPAVHLRHHKFAVALCPSQGPPALPIRHMTPVWGNFCTVMDLDDDVGVLADIFWQMFTLCRGCDHILAGHYLQDHVCDLTNL